ncbi:vWA domain-containing protein [Paenarthrobacter aurescens]|uniref:vWA domain-containing protein n=1 Tax=Paenarthrobacter aurescens TaxID=43663 RepID=UPI0021BEE520|nr:VWA domain-containing protein [Paenarthrobacter aurescens]MCT9867806.1 VWA domain-containing protein [Paenarthrobacter aurescens]
MELTYWWILPLAVAAAAIGVLLHLRRRRPHHARLIAHGDRLTDLPEYQRALRNHRTRLALAVVMGAVFLAATATAAARPIHRTVEQPEVRNRDIVLCLDVSGSMTSTDAAIATVFQRLAKEFDGERIGMVIFDSSSVQLFPLTDDYDYAAEQLTQAKEALESGAGSFFDGTWNGEGSSLIGDGLASCVQSFPDTGTDTGTPDATGGAPQDTKRSRSVVLATDNFLSGEPVVTLDEAARMAAAKNVKVHALNPGDMDYGAQADQPGAQLRAATEHTGGSYFTLDSPESVPGIVQKVQETETNSYRAAPQSVIADSPAWPLSIALIAGTGMLVLGRRLEP